MKYCKGYVGSACVDGSCPTALREEYEMYSLPKNFKCSECWLYKGCEDCVFAGTEHCERESET